ncbi:MAG: deoxyribose-phosphate aldolase [Bdellovibrionales bacterium]|nr:deoxyribose-phosphate aldolase [Bdellovibrionales bacterium]
MATKDALTQGAETLSDNDFAKLFDHTLLSPTATTKDYVALCNEANQYQFFSICVPPVWVNSCKALLGESEVQLCTVLGFPLGYSVSESKAFEAEKAVKDGATELDMVMALTQFKDGDFSKVQKDIELVVKAAAGNLVKVILETGYLDKSEIVKACQICEAAGADFVKTSTGFASSGATVEAIQVMRETVGSRLGVKASGGIRDFQAAKAMIKAGANRLGASKSIEIIKGPRI